MSANIPDVILPPTSRGSIQEGFNQLARLLAHTLGPTQGVVWSTTALKPAPESIADAATIARRITGLADRSQEVGAMILRNMVWRVNQRVGDGGATTAVLAQAVLERASRYVAAGANSVMVQNGIQRAASRAVDAITQMALPVSCPEELAAIANSVTGEPELSFILSEMFDLLGEHAHILIEDYMEPYLEREYINGGQWQAKLISPYLISAPASGEAICTNCNVVLYNGGMSEAGEIFPLIEQLQDRPDKDLLLVAHKISGEALNLLVSTYVQNKKVFQIVAVDLFRAGEKALNDLEDLAVLTGARLLNPQTGDRLTSIQKSDFGIAQRAEASAEHLFVTGGKGSPAAVREKINSLYSYLGTLSFDNKDADEVKMRLGRLSGSSGILKIGAHSKNERHLMHQKARQAVQSLHAALEAGILPGGGTAFLHCIPSLDELVWDDEDEQLGCQAVMFALQRPFEQILKNAGIHAPGSFAQAVASAPPGLVYDAYHRRLCHASDASVYDAAKVLCTILETVSSGVRMALSTEVILLKRNPRVTYNP